MLRKFAVIVTTFITSFFLLASPVRAENIFPDFNLANEFQSSSIYDSTQEIIDNLGGAVEAVGDVIEVITVGGTIICIAGSIASTTVLPPAAAILPYCSAIGILDGGNAATKVIKKPKTAWNVLKYVF